MSYLTLITSTAQGAASSAFENAKAIFAHIVETTWGEKKNLSIEVDNCLSALMDSKTIHEKTAKRWLKRGTQAAIVARKHHSNHPALLSFLQSNSQEAKDASVTLFFASFNISCADDVTIWAGNEGTTVTAESRTAAYERKSKADRDAAEQVRLALAAGIKAHKAAQVAEAASTQANFTLVLDAAKARVADLEEQLAQPYQVSHSEIEEVLQTLAFEDCEFYVAMLQQRMVDLAAPVAVAA